MHAARLAGDAGYAERRKHRKMRIGKAPDERGQMIERAGDKVDGQAFGVVRGQGHAAGAGRGIDWHVPGAEIVPCAQPSAGAPRRGIPQLRKFARRADRTDSGFDYGKLLPRRARAGCDDRRFTFRFQILPEFLGEDGLFCGQLDAGAFYNTFCARGSMLSAYDGNSVMLGKHKPMRVPRGPMMMS